MQQNGPHPSLTPARVYPAPRQRVRPSQRQTAAAAARDTQSGAPLRKPRGRFFFALLGFAFGVAFWHAVGFWDFVSTVVYKPERQARVPIEIQIGIGEKATASLVTPPRAMQPVVGCSSLIINRESGEIRVLPCPVNAPDLRDGGGETRGDLQPVRATEPGKRAPAVATWSAIINEQGGAKPR